MTDGNDDNTEQNSGGKNDDKSKPGPKKFGNLEDRKVPNFGNLEDRR